MPTTRTPGRISARDALKSRANRRQDQMRGQVSEDLYKALQGLFESSPKMLMPVLAQADALADALAPGDLRRKQVEAYVAHLCKSAQMLSGVHDTFGADIAALARRAS